ncbi:olfactory receptor 5V1-like [Heliangelus exortis]|uniref:olfactory receptor 5V1-like n=1 Tax=Heliangelus exortis TaxID=472823 RepID=UPI003A8D337B
MENQTSAREFVLLGLTGDPHLQNFLFFVFSIIYFVTLFGNMMVMVVISSDPHLHSPMYFFVFHLALIDICYATTIVPYMLVNFLVKQQTIVFSACITQMSLILLSAGSEILMLSAMAYDRYVAICKPLHYQKVMTKLACQQLVGGVWAMGALQSLINTLPMLKVQFCKYTVIQHFSCELPPLLTSACGRTFLNKLVLLASAVIFGSSSFLLILISYIYIISTILKIQSAKGRHKAFSTCSSHLIVVVLLYTTALFQYTKSSSVSFFILDQLFSIQYSIFTPMLNPIIYSLKNNDMKAALGRMLGKIQGLQSV